MSSNSRESKILALIEKSAWPLSKSDSFNVSVVVAIPFCEKTSLDEIDPNSDVFSKLTWTPSSNAPSESSTVSLSAEIEVIYEMLKHSFSHLLSNQGTLSKRLLTCLWLVLFGAIITYGIFWIWMLILGQESNDVGSKALLY